MSAAPLKLAAWHDRFVALLLSRPGATGLEEVSSQPGFAVYRNTFLKACIDALQANYPAVLRLVGEDWFRAAAGRFALECPPREPMLAAYGVGFDAFLAGFEPARELPWLPDVARLDRAWTLSHLAADAPVLEGRTLAALTGEQLGALVLAPHPAARWVWSEAFPAYAIWSATREKAPEKLELEPGADGALLTRPDGEVRWQPATRAACRLLHACAAGERLVEATAFALESVETDPVEALLGLLVPLLEAGAFRALPTQEIP